MNIFSEIWIVTALLALSANANVQSNLEQLGRMNFAARIDYECTSKTYPRQRLGRLVRESMKEIDADTSVYGKRAVGYDLNKDGKLEYFIPLDCGNLNCMWGIFSADPPKLLGKIAAEQIYIERRAGWPVLAAYVYAGGSDRVISVYKYSNSAGYTKSGEDAEVNVDRKDQPASMQSTRSLCGKSNAAPARRKADSRSNAHD